MSVRTENQTYLVAACKPWSIKVFTEKFSSLPGTWQVVSSKNELTADYVRALAPRYIFFLHWNWKVSDDILAASESVCFHMTDVPFGRGGSPLQNLILRGLQTTKLTALRMSNQMDAGPVYFKRDLSLHGSAGEIYLRANYLAAEMISSLIHEHPAPVPQTGEPTLFQRRTPAQSEIPEGLSGTALYDFIRMLDAEGYPKAFITRGDSKFEFDQARIDGSEVSARVNVLKVTNK